MNIDLCACSPAGGGWRSRADRRINTTLPESGSGFRTYNREPDGVDQVARRDTVDFILRTGEAWAEQATVPCQVGDLSRAGGGPFPPHKGHDRGNEADFRPFRQDGQMLPTNIHDPSYERSTTRDFVEVLKRLQPGALVFFNDPILIGAGLTRHADGHDNHLHLRLPL